MKKTLIAYYSRRGENFFGGQIVNLELGSTEVFVSKIAELIPVDLFHIETVKAYPEKYNDCTALSQIEMAKQARPEIIGEVENMQQYDNIIIAYPNWWGTAPMAVFTFLEKYDMIKKNILPICTFDRSNLGHSVEDIKRSCPHANVLPGVAIHGARVKHADQDAVQVAETILHL